jgi:hypothetical protein
MKAKIREKRKLAFENKRITPEVVRRLAAIVNAQVESTEGDQNALILFSIDGRDSSSYESQSVEIFESGQFLDTKHIQKVNMRLLFTDGSKNIEIQIVEVEKGGADNFISVSGDNPTWVNGVLAQFSEIINSCEMQPQYSAWLGWGILGLWFLFEVFIWRILDRMPPATNGTWKAWIVVAFLLGSPFYAMHAHEKLKSLYPSIELQTGPDYLQQPLQKRTTFYWWMSTIVIPIVLAAAYDIGKEVFKLF